MTKPIDNIAGKKFGMLFVTATKVIHKGRLKWMCKCDCGKDCPILSYALIQGSSKSCGCAKSERARILRTKHGLSNKIPEYDSWLGMRKRCLNKKDPKYPRYGGRGITICERWLNSFALFFKDVGSKPSPQHTLGRIDNNGNYELGNVRWETPAQQANNTVRTHWFLYQGEMRTIKEISSLCGVPRSRLKDRLLVLGWTVEKATVNKKFSNQFDKDIQ